MCGSAKLVVMERDTLVDEDVSQCHTDDILVACPESTGRRAKTEDLSVGDDNWTDDILRRSHLVTRFDLSTTTVHQLTVASSDDGCEELRSNVCPTEYYDVDEGVNTTSEEVINDPCTDGAREYAASASYSQYTFSNTDGVNHTDVHLQVSYEEDVENSMSAVVDGVVRDLQNTCTSDIVSSAAVKPRNDEDCCECDNCEDNKLFSHHMLDDRDVQDSVHSAVCESVENSQNTSSCGVAPSVAFEPEDCEDCHECDESEANKYPSTGSVAASEAASNWRYVSRLHITLGAKPSCSRDNQSFAVDVSNDLPQSHVFYWPFCMNYLACRYCDVVRRKFMLC